MRIVQFSHLKQLKTNHMRDFIYVLWRVLKMILTAFALIISITAAIALWDNPGIGTLLTLLLSLAGFIGLMELES